MTSAAEKAVEAEKTTAPDKRKALGRGLESLLPGGPRVVTGTTAAPASANSIVLPEIQAQAARVAAGDAVLQVRLDDIEQNPYQTRDRFDTELLQELAESIRANGVVQPIVVRPGKDGRYVLILGERRCRASKLAGKETISAIVRKVSDQQAAEMTIVENLQRQDLNCLEQAHAFAQLSQVFHLTQDQIGQRTGCSRESISNYMRLLKLPASVQQFLREGRLGFSEARVLLTLLDPNLIPKIADEAVRKHLSVEQLEDLVFDTNVPLQKQDQPGRGARWVDPNVRAAQTELERVLGVRVRIRDRKGKGKIVIEYATLEDFDRVVEMLRGKQ
jgi:ParB family transcriptional regulator, chromosome partitioning protein